MTVLDSVDRTFYTPINTLLANLRVLDKAIRSAGPVNLVVVGFTEGTQFVSPGAMRPDGELGELSDFPIVSGVTTAFRKFSEPYNLMLDPGAILIDSQGILLAFYDHPLTERELLDAVALTDWDKPVRPDPVEDHWSGNGPPQPSHTATLVWSRDLPRVVGMTGGDWDLRGSDDLILAAGRSRGSTRSVDVLGWTCSVTGRKCPWSTRTVKTWQRSLPTVTNSSKWRRRKWLAREKGKSCLFGRRTLGHWTTWSRRTSKATSSGNTP